MSTLQKVRELRFTSPLVAIAVLVFAVVGPFVPLARAAALTNVSDTLSDSDLSVTANHTIAYTSAQALTAGQTLKIQFDPTSDAFTLGAIVVGDFTGTTGMTVVAACTGAASEVTLTVDSSAPDENVTFTVCAGDTISAGAKSIVIGNNRITNPASAGSRIIRIESNSTTPEAADTMVAIIDDVDVTASVATTLTFTVSGMPEGVSINDEATNTSTTTTATSMPFGTLVPGTPKVAAQRLNVTTNAANGFTVTVRQNQNLLSATGADIDVFQNGLGTAAPNTWAAPAETLGSEATYGHYGITSSDDLNADEFGSALYVGNFATTSRAIFHHNGPADGTTANVGSTTVAVKIEISDLQEAGNDYNNTLTYVATPIF